MQRTAHRCPSCSRGLAILSDMWGPYYVCSECGFTAEDDDQLKAGTARSETVPPPLLTAGAPTYRHWRHLRSA